MINNQYILDYKQKNIIAIIKDIFTSPITIVVILFISQNSLGLATIDSNRIKKIEKFNNLAFSQININPESSFNYVDSSLTLNTKDSISIKELSNSYTILGILNKNKGYYQIAVSNYLQALDFSEQLSDWKRASVYLNNIGVILFLNGKHKDAIEYYQQSVKLEKRAKNQEQLSIRYYNIGECYQAIEQFDSALFYFSKSLNIEKKIANQIGLKYALYGLSNLYLSVNDYENSKAYLDTIKMNNFDIQDNELKCKVLLNEVELSIQNKSYPEALEYCIKVNTISTEHQYSELNILSLEKLNRIYHLLKNKDKQLEILEALNLIQKKRYQNQINIKVEEQQKLYEQQKQKEEIAYLKNNKRINQLEISHSKKIKNYLFFTVFIVIIIFIINIIGLNRIRKKQ